MFLQRLAMFTSFKNVTAGYMLIQSVWKAFKIRGIRMSNTSMFINTSYKIQSAYCVKLQPIVTVFHASISRLLQSSNWRFQDAREANLEFYSPTCLPLKKKKKKGPLPPLQSKLLSHSGGGSWTLAARLPSLLLQEGLTTVLKKVSLNLFWASMRFITCQLCFHDRLDYRKWWKIGRCFLWVCTHSFITCLKKRNFLDKGGFHTKERTVHWLSGTLPILLNS